MNLMFGSQIKGEFKSRLERDGLEDSCHYRPITVKKYTSSDGPG